MQASTLHNTEVYVPLTKNIQRVHSMMERIMEDFTIGEIHPVIFNWMGAVRWDKNFVAVGTEGQTAGIFDESSRSDLWS